MAERVPADLVIGLGNPLRGDDGVGPWLAQRAAVLRRPARVLVVQQLTPELCDVLAAAGRVLFVDAWLQPDPGASLEPPAAGDGPAAMAAPPVASRSGPAGPALLPVGPACGGGEAAGFSHRLDPQQLLAITALLHQRVPPAWQLLLPAYDLGHGERFSQRLRRHLPEAERLLRRWCEGHAAALRCGGPAPHA